MIFKIDKIIKNKNLGGKEMARVLIAGIGGGKKEYIRELIRQMQI